MSTPTWVSLVRLRWDFRRHGHEFPFSTVDDYEASSLDTINIGVRFEFEDRKNGRNRLASTTRRRTD